MSHTGKNLPKFRELWTPSLKVYKSRIGVLLFVSLLLLLPDLIMKFVHIKSPSSYFDILLDFLYSTPAWLMKLLAAIFITQLTALHLEGETAPSVQALLLKIKSTFWRVFPVRLGYSLIVWAPLSVYYLLCWATAHGCLETVLSFGFGLSRVDMMTYSMFFGNLLFIWLSIMLYFATTGAVLDHWKFDAYFNSVRMIRKRFWPLTGRVALFGIILFALPIALYVAGCIFGKGEMPSNWDQPIEWFNLIYYAFVTPLAIIFNTVFYMKMKPLQTTADDLVECQKGGESWKGTQTSP